MYRNIKDYLTESETTQEAVGEPAAPLYDLIDEVGSHQLVLDELVRFLDVDQIEEFVADFRRHHDMQEASIGAPDYNPAAGKWEHNMDDEDEDEDEEKRYQIRYLPYDSDKFKIVKGFTSKEEAEKYAKAENFDELADEWNIEEENDDKKDESIDLLKKLAGL